MRHKNPTPTASTPPSGQACSDRAGSGLRALEEAELSLSELLKLTPVQRVQLSELARESLDEEIVLLRKVLRQFVSAVNSDEEEAKLNRLAKVLDLLGLTASRLAGVLRVNRNLSSGSADDERIQAILNNLQAALMEDLAQKEGER